MNVFILTFMEKDCEVRLQPEKAISQVKLQKVTDKYITKQSLLVIKKSILMATGL